jgi:hypothetical protein
LALASKDKGKEKKKKKGGKRNIEFSKANVPSVTRWDTLPHSVLRRRRRMCHRWQLLQQ